MKTSAKKSPAKQTDLFARSAKRDTVKRSMSRATPAPLGIANAGTVLASVKRGSGAVLVRRVDFGKGLVIDVRFFYRDADTDTLMPTKSGLVFSESKDLLTLSNALLSISRGAL